MSTSGELEAVVAKAEAAWRKAQKVLDEAQGERDKANAGWAKVLHDRRRSSTDRRKAGTSAALTFPDRRNPEADRRKKDEGIAALSKAVAAQHEAYLGRDKAEADWAAAEAALRKATDTRDRAIAALDQAN